MRSDLQGMGIGECGVAEGPSGPLGLPQGRGNPSHARCAAAFAAAAGCACSGRGGRSASRRRRPWARLVPCRSRALSEGRLAPEPPALYAAVVLSATFMALWVFVAPGSAWIGLSSEHDDFVRDVYERCFGYFGPASLLLKYNVMGPAIELTHALPGAVWCLLAPLQLNPEVRARDGGLVHRALGRLMLVAASVLMVGYALIDANRLFADTSDFAGHGGALAAAADALNESRLGGTLPPFNVGGVRFIAAWFVFAGLQTYLTATQRPMPVEEHRRWALRHIAAGLWVAFQRPFFAAVRCGQAIFLGLPAAASPESQADAFYGCALAATVAYALAAEWAALQRSSSDPGMFGSDKTNA